MENFNRHFSISVLYLSFFIDYHKNRVTNYQHLISKLAESVRKNSRIPDLVYKAFQAVPRHIFIEPYFKNNQLTIAQCYEDVVVRLKTTSSGFASTSSVPSLMAQMMALADLAPGQRVVEIGTGSGYGAALLASTVGDSGFVSTVDIDAELTYNAQIGLSSLGYCDMVEVLTEDGFRTAVNNTFDRLIATVSCPIIPDCWFANARVGYKMVVPLQLPDSGPLLVLDKQNDGSMLGRASTWVIFVDPQGASSQFIANNQTELAQRHSKQRIRRYKTTERMSYLAFCAFRIIVALTSGRAIDFILYGHFPDIALVSESGLVVIREDELVTYGEISELMECYNSCWAMFSDMGKPQLSNLVFSIPAKPNSIIYRRGSFEIGVSI